MVVCPQTEEDTLPPAGSPCGLTPVDQAVPFTELEPGVTVRWGLAAGCIPVTYSPDVADISELLTEAVTAWSEVSCSQLCFENPIAMAASPDLPSKERRIHVREEQAGDGLAVNQVGLSELSFDNRNGVAISAEIILAQPTLREELTIQGLLHFLGTAIGLGTPDDGVVSVMSETMDDGRVLTAPTVPDAEALCRLYGDPPLCKE
jgi:hypothetical protein